MLGKAKTVSAIVCSLIVLTGTSSRAVGGTSPQAGAIGGMPLCRDARFTVGMSLAADTDLPAGDVRAVDAILDGNRAGIGYRYTLNDGRAYVTDRSRGSLTLSGLATMNDLVNAMSSFSYNAFDSRDNGYIAYPVHWRPETARRLAVTTARCS